MDVSTPGETPRSFVMQTPSGRKRRHKFARDRCVTRVHHPIQLRGIPGLAPFSSGRPHVMKVDVTVNSSLRTIYGCLKPTPVFQLPVLAGIAPVGIWRKAATLTLARKAVKHDWNILHDPTKNEVPPCRLKSRKPYNKEAHEMLSVIPVL